MVDYPVTEALILNAGQHCAAIAISNDHTVDKLGSLVFSQPHAGLRSGTLTFVRSEGRTFGITCHHVVQTYRDLKQVSAEVSYSMRTMLNGFHVVTDRFIQPGAQWPESPPDIAIREVRSDFIAHLGKTPIELDAMQEPPDHIRHGLAVGFPEAMKYNKTNKDEFGYRVSMPQVEVLAELERRPLHRFAMFSEISPPPEGTSYSGISGGPIFWSTEDEYGIIGIIYEGGAGAGNSTIFVYGELATPQIIRRWISECPALSDSSQDAVG